MPVNLSTSAVQRRLKRLRQDKIIEADISIVSPAAVGIEITCVVDGFKTLMSECAEVMQCYYVTGTYDFVIIINARDMKSFQKNILWTTPM